MAPSPTGFLHVGTARTTLFNWLFARHHEGVFILRSEDTDRERSKPEHELTLIEGLKWLGIEWDEGPDLAPDGTLITKGDYGPYRQSERTSLYHEYLQKLIDSGHAYYCFCTKEELDAERKTMEAAGLPPIYSGRCKTNPPTGRIASVIRFIVPTRKVSFDDMIRDRVEFDATLFGDIVIAKNLDEPLYNVANVIDDYLMKITHVIRGEEHLANTPKQILLWEAFGFGEFPRYAHLPLILNADRSKMSKRTNKASLLEYREEGYLPEALLNFLSLLGWHPEGDEEIMSADTIIEKFSIERVQKSGAIFNPEKLDWMNAQYIKQLSVDDLFAYIQPILEKNELVASRELVTKILVVERDRFKKLSDIIEFDAFIFQLPEYDASLLNWKTTDPAITKQVLAELTSLLSEYAGDYSRDSIMTALDPLITTYDKGSVLWPLRVALSGQKASPDPLAIAGILGKEEVTRRLEIAIEKL